MMSRIFASWKLSLSLSLCSKKALCNRISIASFMRRLDVFLSVVRTLVQLEFIECHMNWQCSRSAEEFINIFI